MLTAHRSASTRRQTNGRRAALTPNTAHNPTHGHGLRSGARSGGATDGGTGTPAPGITLPTIVTGSPTTASTGLPGWWTAATEDSFEHGTSAHALGLYAQERASVVGMVEDVKAATAAITAGDPALMRAFLTNGQQKVMAVVDETAKEPDVFLLHSPALATRESTTITFVEGELHADNRADLVDIGEDAYSAKELVAQPTPTFEAFIDATPTLFAPKPRSNGNVEAWTAATMAYIPPILVADALQGHTVASLYRLIKGRLEELQLTEDQQNALAPMLRQLKGLGTNSKCGANQHGSNGGTRMTAYMWGEDARGDRAIRSTCVAMGLEVRPTNAPVYQEQDEEEEQDAVDLTANADGRDQGDESAGSQHDEDSQEGDEEEQRDTHRQNLAGRFDAQTGTGDIGGQGMTIPPYMESLMTKMMQAATAGLAKGLGQTATARMMTSHEGLLDPTDKKIAGRIKVDDEDRAPLLGWNNQHYTDEGPFPLSEFFEKTTDSQRRRLLNNTVSDDKADPPLVFFAGTSLIKDLKAFKYAPSQDASNCNNWSRGITPATLAPRSKAEQQEIKDNEEAEEKATQVSLSEAKADFNRAIKVPVNFDGMMLWLKHSHRFLQAFFPNGSLCSELDTVYKLLRRKQETLKAICGRNQVAATLTVVTQAFMDYFSTESTPEDINGDNPTFPKASLAALTMFLDVGAFPPTDSVDNSLLTFQPAPTTTTGGDDYDERGASRRKGKRKTEEDEERPNKRGTIPTKPGTIPTKVGTPFKYDHRHPTVAAVMDPLLSLNNGKLSLVKLCRHLGIEGGSITIPSLEDRCARCELGGECYFGATCKSIGGHAQTKPMAEDKALRLAKFLKPGVDKYIKAIKAAWKQQE